MRIPVASLPKLAGLMASLMVAAACASPGASAPAASGGAQVVQTAAAGEACTFDKYNGSGVPKLDLKTATIGFAQSEKEANPFRIAETQSIKDEAAKLGVKLITTNAESDLNKEISDIKGMIDQGAQALIISPLNSEGLDPALEYAQSKNVPIMTIDRFLTTKTACKDFVGWVGSDFVEQGKRAFDALSLATADVDRLVAADRGKPGDGGTAAGVELRCFLPGPHVSLLQGFLGEFSSRQDTQGDSHQFRRGCPIKFGNRPPVALADGRQQGFQAALHAGSFVPQASGGRRRRQLVACS